MRARRPLMNRPRRLRQSEAFRNLQRETRIDPTKLIYPVFVTEGSGVEQSHKDVPGIKTLSLDKLTPALKNLYSLGVQSCLIFGVSDKRDEEGSEAVNPESVVAKAISEIREKIPEMIVATDVALDPYTSHGHDGIYRNGEVLNDETVEQLVNMSLVHAQAGAQLIAPSDMMDGRVAAIRQALDDEGYEKASILAYTAKYASAFYGPFRDTLSVELEGDKKSYQMDPANRREAIRELELDISESSDIVMVKPATHYLDVISDFAERSSVPVAAYHVSGEAAMIELGAKAGLFDRERAIVESTTSIFRAGADIVATYFAEELAKAFN